MQHINITAIQKQVAIHNVHATKNILYYCRSGTFGGHNQANLTTNIDKLLVWRIEKSISGDISLAIKDKLSN